MANAFTVAVVFILLGVAVYYTMVRPRARRRALQRLPDREAADRTFIETEAARFLDELLAEDSRVFDDFELKSKTYDRLRSHVRKLRLPIENEAIWEAIDNAVEHRLAETRDEFLRGTALRAIAALRANAPGADDPVTLRGDLFQQLRYAADSRGFEIEDAKIFVIVDAAIESADDRVQVEIDAPDAPASSAREKQVETRIATPPVSSPIDREEHEIQELPEEADMTITNVQDLSEAGGRNIVLLKASPGGGYETLGESFEDADAAGMHLTRELVRAYFPDWLPKGANDLSADTDEEEQSHVAGPWGPVSEERAEGAPGPDKETTEADQDIASAQKPASDEAVPIAAEGHRPIAASSAGEVAPVEVSQTPTSEEKAIAPQDEEMPVTAAEMTPTAGGTDPISTGESGIPGELNILTDPSIPADIEVPALSTEPAVVPAKPSTSVAAANGSSVTLRVATAEDASAVAALANALDREVSDGNEPHTAASVIDGMLSGRLGLVLWVAVPEGETAPVGYALVQDMYDTDSATWITWLHDLYVNETWRSQDIGARLMAHLAVNAKSAGHHGMWWGVHRSNWKAERFYRRLGAARAPIYVMGLAGTAFDEIVEEAA